MTDFYGLLFHHVIEWLSLCFNVSIEIDFGSLCRCHVIYTYYIVDWQDKNKMQDFMHALPHAFIVFYFFH